MQTWFFTMSKEQSGAKIDTNQSITSLVWVFPCLELVTCFPRLRSVKNVSLVRYFISFYFNFVVFYQMWWVNTIWGQTDIKYRSNLMLPIDREPQGLYLHSLTVPLSAITSSSTAMRTSPLFNTLLQLNSGSTLVISTPVCSIDSWK